MKQQIAGKHRTPDALSDLHFWLRDGALWYVISLGIKEAFKMLIVLDEGLLQASAARVAISYPPDCPDLSLRGIPAHHHLEKMIHELSGGKVAIFPDLANPNPKVPEFLRLWMPFNTLWFATRTPLNPAQCLIPVSKAGVQKTKGLLVILALLPKDTNTYVPVGDRGLAGKMTILVNEKAES